MEKYRDAYLDELIRWDGRGDLSSDGLAECPDCVSYKSETPGHADHRCLECYTPILTCKACCVRRHHMDPFHRIQVQLLLHPAPPLTYDRALDMDRQFLSTNVAQEHGSSHPAQPPQQPL